MSTLSVPQTRVALRQRIVALRPDSPRQWGRMTPHQMLCHLSDAFRLADGSLPIPRVDNFLTRSVLRYMVLHTSIPWPKGAKTAPEVDQEQRGTKTVNWDSDHAELVRLYDAFSPHVHVAHPFFGPMSGDDWNIWAYRHIDHHLRQFSA
jgi:hypothetical protein